MAYQSNYTGSQIDAGISKTTKMTTDGDNVTFAGKVTVTAEPTGDMDVVNKGYLSNVSGITAEIKQALLNCFQKVAWIDDQGQDYYDALYDALYPPVGLASISCVYTQSGTVYDTDSLDSLKTDLVVTAHYSDQSSETITTYTLSGTLTEGTSTITVTYMGKTTTFDVTVTEDASSLGYISNGLLMLLDGNANGTGGSHESTISTLVDQTGNGYDWIPKTGTVTADTNALVFGGSSCLQSDSSWASSILTTPKAIEIVIDVTSPSTTSCVICGISQSQSDANNTSLGTIGVKSSNLLHRTGSTYGCIPITTGRHTYSFVNDNGTWKSYKDGELVTNGSTTITWKTGHHRLGCFVGSGGTNESYFFDGKIYSYRYYTESLSASDVASNYANDVSRFGS